MLKKLIILVLILLVAGFYFYPNDTKDLVDTTGHAVKDTTVKIVDDIKNNEELQEKVDDVKEDIKEEFKEESKEEVDKEIDEQFD